MTNLVAGDNVLAVEVHNYSARSPDITFGATATYTAPQSRNTLLSIVSSKSGITLSWDQNGFILQQADEAVGPWNDVPGPIMTSPYTTPASNTTQYYRLRK
jgi:hypothetical protein